MTRTEEMLCRFLTRENVRPRMIRGELFIGVTGDVEESVTGFVEIKRRRDIEVVNLSELARLLEAERV